MSLKYEPASEPQHISWRVIRARQTALGGRMQLVTVRVGRLQLVTVRAGQLQLVTVRAGRLQLVTVRVGRLQLEGFDDLHLHPRPDSGLGL